MIERVVKRLERFGLGRLRLAALAGATTLGVIWMATAILAALSSQDTLRWIAVFGVALSTLLAGFTLWTPNLRSAEDREKVGLALLAASLFFGTGSFMALQNERVSAQEGLERYEAERGFDLAVEKRRLIVELGVTKDLRGIDLRHRDVSGVALPRRRLSRALLTGANLQQSDLRGASLRKATMVRTRLGLAALRNADLRGANVAGARLGRADLRGADLRGVTGLQLAYLRGALADSRTRWPQEGYDVRRAGVICVDRSCGRGS